MSDPSIQSPQVNADPWLTAPEVARELKVNPQTVRIWIRSGRLPAVRTGNRWRVRRSDVDRTFSSHPSPEGEHTPAESAGQRAGEGYRRPFPAEQVQLLETTGVKRS